MLGLGVTYRVRVSLRFCVLFCSVFHSAVIESCGHRLLREGLTRRVLLEQKTFERLKFTAVAFGEVGIVNV